MASKAPRPKAAKTNVDKAADHAATKIKAVGALPPAFNHEGGVKS